MERKMLWIHGWGMSPRIWGDLPSFLPGYEHHRFSYRDCSSVGDFQVALRRKMSEGGRWTLLGWSMGGMLALEEWIRTCTADGGDASGGCEEANVSFRVEAVVVIAATLRFASRDRTAGWPPRVLERMRTRLRENREAVLREFAAAMLSAEEREQYCGAERGPQASSPVDTLLRSAEEADFTPEGLDAGLAYLLETDLGQMWRAWREWSAEPDAVTRSGRGEGVGGERKESPSYGTVPHGTCFRAGKTDGARLLWLHGAEDPICPPGAMPNLPEEGPIRKALLPGSGHAPFLTEEDTFKNIVRSFLNGR